MTSTMHNGSGDAAESLHDSAAQTPSLIRPLAQSTVRRIVAEQAITDLSGIVKELVDNALDAGSTCINVRLFGHGLEIIEVTDDGSGVPAHNRKLLATRYATSKIRSLDDIYNNTSNDCSLGFRGEALFSMAALSDKLIVATRTAAETSAVRLEYARDGSLVEPNDGFLQIPRKVGTTVAIVKPFHTLPARRADMARRIRSERSKLFRLMQSYAIFHVGKRINLIDMVSHGSGQREETAVTTSHTAKHLKENISSVLGHNFLSSMAPLTVDLSAVAAQHQQQLEQQRQQSHITVSASTAAAASGSPGQSSPPTIKHAISPQPVAGSWSLSGFISKSPASTKTPQASVNYFCINGRPVDLPKITAVMRKAWQSFGGKRKPSCILHLRIPNNAYDINVAPDKREVLMMHEQDVVHLVQAAITTYWSSQVHGSFQLSQLEQHRQQLQQQQQRIKQHMQQLLSPQRGLRTPPFSQLSNISPQRQLYQQIQLQQQQQQQQQLQQQLQQQFTVNAASRLNQLQSKVLDRGDATDARALEVLSPDSQRKLHKRRNAFVHDLSKAKMQHELEERAKDVYTDLAGGADANADQQHSDEVVESIVVDGDEDSDTDDEHDDGTGNTNDGRADGSDRMDTDDSKTSKAAISELQNEDSEQDGTTAPRAEAETPLSQSVRTENSSSNNESQRDPVSSGTPQSQDLELNDETKRVMKRRRVSRDREIVGSDSSAHPNQRNDSIPNEAMEGRPQMLQPTRSHMQHLDDQQQFVPGRRISRETESIGENDAADADLPNASNVAKDPAGAKRDATVDIGSPAAGVTSSRSSDDTHQTVAQASSQVQTPTSPSLRAEVSNPYLRKSSSPASIGSRGSPNSRSSPRRQQRYSRHRKASDRDIREWMTAQTNFNKQSSPTCEELSPSNSADASNDKASQSGHENERAAANRRSASPPRSPTSVLRKRDFSQFARSSASPTRSPTSTSASPLRRSRNNSTSPRSSSTLLEKFGFQPNNSKTSSRSASPTRARSRQGSASRGVPSPQRRARQSDPDTDVMDTSTSTVVARLDEDLAATEGDDRIDGGDDANEQDEADDDGGDDDGKEEAPVFWGAYESTEAVAREAREYRTEMRERKLALRRSKHGTAKTNSDAAGSADGVLDLQRNGGGETPRKPSVMNGNGTSNDGSGDTTNDDDDNIVRLSKEDFRDGKMQILGQFNLGFILAKCQNNNLWILDQHACDEKYNFENLIRDTVIHEQKLIRPMPLELSSSEESCILDHMDIFTKNGFRFEHDPSAPIRHRLKLTALPHSGAQDGRKSVQFGKDDVSTLCAILSEGSAYEAGDGGIGTDGTGRYGNNAVRRYASASQMTQTQAPAAESSNDDNDMDVAGAGAGAKKQSSSNQILARLPKAIAMFASRACRTSIMIGTALSQKEMDQVVQRLADVEHPWNCPHGRPTMRHIGDLFPILRDDQRQEQDYYTGPTATITLPTQMTQDSEGDGC